MKKLVLILSLPVLLITACDKVKNPIEKKDTVTGTNFIIKDNKARSGYKKVMLEDYTGHTCGYCPKAAQVADTLAIIYKDSIVVISVHAGGYAAVKQPDYPVYLGTEAGEEWFLNPPVGFGIKSAGNPNGLINRKIYPGSSIVQAYTKWKSTVPYSLKNDPFIVKLDVTTEYDPDVRALNTKIASKFVKSYSNEVKISALLLEDSIIGSQTDYRYIPDHILDFKFEHTLRASLNGSAWGNILKSPPILQNDSISTLFSGFAVDPGFNDKKLSVVVFAYDANTLEVLQVEKVKIR